MLETAYINFLPPEISVDSGQKEATYIVEVLNKGIKLRIVGGFKSHEEVVSDLGLVGIILGGGLMELDEPGRTVHPIVSSARFGAFPTELLERYFQCFGYVVKTRRSTYERNLIKEPTIKWLESHGVNLDALYTANIPSTSPQPSS